VTPRLTIEYQDKRRGARLGWLLLVVAVLLTFDAVYVTQSLKREAVALRNHLQGKAAANGSTRVDGKSAKGADAQVAEAEEVVRQLATPWHTLFRSLEHAYVEEIALLAVQPDAQRRTVAIVGEAREYGDILAYLTRLRAEAPLADAYLVGNEVKESDPQRPLVFTIAAQWRPDP
jgi:hypothetical protein